MFAKQEGGGLAADRVPAAHATTDADRRAHNLFQQRVFDLVADQFVQPIPSDVTARMRRIVRLAGLHSGLAVLDVGTGTGAMLPLVLRSRPKRVVACDLSAEMLKKARQRFAELVVFFHSDVVDLPSSVGHFDRVLCNAVFGNVYDQQLCLDAVSRLLVPNGLLVVSHPMGRDFVARLHRNNPETVPRELPDRIALATMAEKSGLRVSEFVDEPDLYVAVLEPAVLSPPSR